jgi:citrate lyase subunit beta/citryl-CoA lyase
MSETALRTMTFVPGYKMKFLEKARSFDSDALILDLEDSVPYEYKEQARKNIKEFLDADAFPQKVYIRVNALETGLLLKDLEWMLHENTDGFMFSKAADENDIRYFDQLLTQLENDFGFEQGKFKMCPLIETASAVLRAYEMGKASDRNIALVFGGEDYLRDLDGLHKEHGTSLLMPRSLIVTAARAAHIEPIDTPYLDIKDTTGFKKEVDLARELGFSGTLIIHPSQIDIANKAFSPSDHEIDEARQIIEAIKISEKEGLGVALLDGKLIGPPMQKRAVKILEKAKLIGKV